MQLTRLNSFAPTCARLVIWFLFFPAQAALAFDSTDKFPEYIETISVPGNLSEAHNPKPVVVAIVDDGFRHSHEAIREFIWQNNTEPHLNGSDDDLNGYIDDMHGWDVSDRDNDTTIPSGRDDLYHGTHVAGIVATIASAAYRESAPDFLRIMPVKAVADAASDAYVKDGFKGIEYAIRAGADIIIAPWVVSGMTPEQTRTLEAADQAGILIVASSGNVTEERQQFPAAHKSVIAVGSVEPDGRKSERSTYGQFVDIAAPGSSIRSAGVARDDEYVSHDGTSMSAAMVATAAAMIKLRHPELSPSEIRACLTMSSDPITAPLPEMQGKVGAGALNVARAIECAGLHSETADIARINRTKGFLRGNKSRIAQTTWVIEPEGQYSGVKLSMVTDRANVADGTFEFRAGNSADAKLVASFTDEALPDQILVPGSVAHVTFKPRKKRGSLNSLMAFEMETIDFRTLFCKGTQELRVEGAITDGSGQEDYSANTDCKWLITAPPGKVVQFTMEEIDTEPRVDTIYFFDGTGTHEKIMAIFSGQKVPPELTSWNNQVLVWFVTNGQNQGRGWRAHYRFINPP